jgi:hypothetical protein
MSIIGASMVVGLASWVISVAIGCSQSYIRYRLGFYAKERALWTQSLYPHEHHQSINKFWS